ncbi:MAG: hypothetical protein WDN00_17920 [Limisphaerales bacterium]
MLYALRRFNNQAICVIGVNRRQWRVREKKATIVDSRLPNVHYPSQVELEAHAQRLIDNPCWAFNPNFPKAFSFPPFGTAEWLALSCWRCCEGDAAKIPFADKIRPDTMNWPYVWGKIYSLNSVPSSPPVWIPNTTNYSMKHPEGWVQTLLDSQRFWEIEISAWAMEIVEKGI